MSKPWVLLFDIDGTLLKAHGAGKRAINRAFEERFGFSGAVDHIDLQGMTDPLIFKAGLTAIGVPHEAEHIDALLGRYLRYLEEELETPGSAVALPGVTTLLTWLANLGSVTSVGLGTGNVEAGARAKLGRAGLTRHFAFGGYGSDHELRSEVLRVGAERGAALLGRPLADCRTLVIGDTQRDIEAAHAIGAACLAVATSGRTKELLESGGAAFAVEDLTEPSVYEYLAGLLGVERPPT